MLHIETVDKQTLELLKSLQGIESLKNTRLVGGTGLALQLGHRVSIDIDLFANSLEEDFVTITSEIKQLGYSMEIRQQSSRILIAQINAIKVDIVNYPFPWIDEITEIAGIRMASVKEIAAMKLSAIANRGTRKDFIDLYFLLGKYSLKEMLRFYEEKYADHSIFSVLKSLTFFDDAERDLIPKILYPNLSWNEIKDRIIKETKAVI